MRNRFLAVVGAVAVLSLAWPALVAQITIPNSFTNGTVADPDAVNANFTALGTQALNRAGGTMTAQLNVQNLTPTTDATYALGDISHRFATGYFSGSVTALSFAGSGAALTTLNATALTTGTADAARLGGGTANTTTFLRGDSTWQPDWQPFTITTTGTLNDWAPGVVGNLLLRVNNAATLTITGVTAGYAGQLLLIEPVGAANVFTKHQNAGSAAANRFQNQATIGDTPLSTGGSALYSYDATLGAWRLIAHEQGAWITETFSAGNYTNNNATAWTLTAGDELQRAYLLRGHTLQVTLQIATSTVGSGATSLRVAIPNGFQAMKLFASGCFYQDNGATTAGGQIRATAAFPAFVEFFHADPTATWAVATDTTSVYGTLSFEVQ